MYAKRRKAHKPFAPRDTILGTGYTLQKRIPTRSRMRKYRLICTFLRQNYPIRPGAFPTIWAPIHQNWELVVRPRIGEQNTFAVIVLMGVATSTDRGALLEVQWDTLSLRQFREKHEKSRSPKTIILLQPPPSCSEELL